MCGIAGYVGGGDRSSAERAIRLMVNAIAHRGPDGEGIESWPHAVLGHRRLSILDLSDAGRQPMLSDDRSIGVVFNGCIYNFLELREELQQRGARFRSNCDTEVLVRGYQEWGIDALVARLRGMFAFAIWDDPRQTLLLVRDRLGVKPLVYSLIGNRIAFASTVTALQSAGFAGDINPLAVQEFLELNYITDAHTIFDGVSKLGAATILEWRNGAASERRYWSVPHPEESSPEAKMSFDEAVERTEQLLIESVRLRLHADVPIGVLLSSGIDSALVCWAMTRLNANIAAFTVSTPGDTTDEAAATQETARLLNIPLQVVTLPKDEGSGIIDQMIQAYAEPFGAQSALAMLRVSAAVKPYATVLLTGDGGDDVFLGYNFYRHYFESQRIARYLPEFSTGLWQAVRPLAKALPGLRRPIHFIDYCTGGLGSISRAGHGLAFYRERNMLGDRLRQAAELPYRQIPLSIGSARKLLSELLDYQQRMWFTGHFMTKVDGGTMFQALEARAPFLDQKLWEFGARLPFGTRLRGDELKPVLREIVRRRVGPDVAVRKKRGFEIPAEQWIVNPQRWGNVLREVQEDPWIERDGWIRRGAIREAAREARQLGTAPNQLWLLVLLEKWMRRKGAQALAA